MVFGDAVESFVGVPVMQFPPAARKFLSSFDTDGNGVIDMGELEHAARLLGDARKGNLTVEQFPERLRDTVRALDDEGNGVLEIDEIAEMVEMYAAVKEANKRGEIDIRRCPRRSSPRSRSLTSTATARWRRSSSRVAPNSTSSRRRWSRSSRGWQSRCCC